jgi:hypothetical protein
MPTACGDITHDWSTAIQATFCLWDPSSKYIPYAQCTRSLMCQRLNSSPGNPLSILRAPPRFYGCAGSALMPATGMRMRWHPVVTYVYTADLRRLLSCIRSGGC